MTAPTAAVTDVMAERRRQVEQEGWTPGHDDTHDDGSLALAAVCYAHPKFRGRLMHAIRRHPDRD
jgi:hypothetical protein